MYQVKFKAVFRLSRYKGVPYSTTMNFVDWDDAVRWANGVNANKKADFYVKEMVSEDGSKGFRG